MRPTLAADEVRQNLTRYLTTTFALADEPVRDGLEPFLGLSRGGMTRGNCCGLHARAVLHATCGLPSYPVTGRGFDARPRPVAGPPPVPARANRPVRRRRPRSVPSRGRAAVSPEGAQRPSCKTAMILCRLQGSWLGIQPASWVEQSRTNET